MFRVSASIAVVLFAVGLVNGPALLWVAFFAAFALAVFTAERVPGSGSSIEGPYSGDGDGL